MEARAPSTVDRRPLSRDLVLATAARVADRDGLPAVTMRRVGAELGVEAMSLYHHVPNKAALLDGMAEHVMAEVLSRAEAVTGEDGPWPGLVRRTVLAAREVVLAHPWAAPLIGRAGMNEAVLGYFDLLGRRMLAAGLTADLVHHGIHALGSRAVGFSEELFDEGSSGEVDAEALQAMASRYPAIAAVAALAADHDPASTVGWCDDQAEFEFGLDLILEGLGRRAG